MGAVDKQYTFANADNMNYLADLTMGSASATVKVVLDTSSVGLAVMGSACTTNCVDPSLLYAEGSSTDYVNDGASHSHQYRNSLQPVYWWNTVSTTSTDRVHIDADNNTYKFYLITSNSNPAGANFLIPSMAGFLGLGLNRAPGASQNFDFMQQVVDHTFLAGNQ